VLGGEQHVRERNDRARGGPSRRSKREEREGEEKGGRRAVRREMAEELQKPVQRRTRGERACSRDEYEQQRKAAGDPAPDAVARHRLS
jgi:hypothetical protein